MMNIILLEHKNKGLYYDDFAKALKQKANVFHYGPGFKYYSQNHDISAILNLYSFVTGIEKPDLICIGFGWALDGKHPTEFEFNSSLGLEDITIKKALILNKEYKKLKKKLIFVKQRKIDLVFTVHHKYKEWRDLLGVPFYRMPFAADHDVFKDYGQEKTIDLGFSGNLFNNKEYKSGLMGKNFNNIRERIKDELGREEYKDFDIWFNSNPGKYYYGVEYSKLINRSKLWLCTPSAVDLVGPRFYEIIASNSLLFAKKCEEAYEELGFIDGVNCVLFEDNLTDFREKLVYYIENDSEREKIIKNANDFFLNNHTYHHRIDLFLKKARENL